jgi:hypothetical protein
MKLHIVCRILLICILLGNFTLSKAQVKVTDGTVLTLNINSLLELESNNKGLLIPRIAINSVIQVAPLTAPVPAGMLVYSTGGTVTNGFYYWSGTAWLSIATGIGSQWTTSGTNIYYNTGNVGIGASLPAELLDINGNLKIGNSTTGTIRSTSELVLRQDGDVYGSSILRLRNRSGENGAIYETTDPTATVVDFIYKTALNQRNLRYESRASMARTGAPSFHLGGANPDNPTLSLGDNYAAFNKNVRIGDYITPITALDVNGQITLRTGASAGAFLVSDASGTGTWTAILSVANGGTGASVQNFVDLTTIQTIAGAKTWSNPGTFNLGLTSSGAAVNLNSGSNFNTNINTGSTGAVAIGSATGGASIILRVGTGNFSLDGVAGSSYTIGASTVSGTIGIGGAAQTGTITLGSSASVQTVNIGSGEGAAAINIGTGTTAGKTINIGTGSIGNVLNIGTVTGASSLTLKAGSGNIIVPNGVMLDLSQADNSSSSEGLKLPQSNNNTAATSEGQLGWDADNDVLTVGTGTVAKNIGIPNGMAAFTSSNAAWAHPAGIKFVWIKVWGGGGGGGTATNNLSGGGGGGGAYSEGIVDVSDAAAHAILVGAAGTADGGNGGISSFTTTAMTVSANGGTGSTTLTGGAGGTVSGTGAIKIPGGKGGDADNQDGAGGGNGGGSPFGGAGGGGAVGANTGNPSTAGTTGTFPGGGGGGGSENSGAGAAGAAGYVIVYW